MLERLSKRAHEAKKNQSGFTLIELLIVIVILGILAAIVVFSIQGITDRGNSAACKSDIKTVTVAGEAYYAQNGSYAATGAALVPSFLHSFPTDVAYATTATSFTVTGIDGTGATPKSNNCAGVTA